MALPIPFQTYEKLVIDATLNSFWGVRIYTYDGSSNITYLACNKVQSTGTDATSWHIWKYTWSGGNLTMTEGPLIGSVDGQTSLGWRA
jgi:hypothetical protein